MNTTLDEILQTKDRTPIEGARPVVSLHDDDEPDYVAALEQHGLATVENWRRGKWHGRWVELDPAIDPRCELPRPSLQRRRWKEARPLVWRGRFSAALAKWRNELHDAERAGERLQEPDGLDAYLRRRLGGRKGGGAQRFEVRRVEAGGADPERDLHTAFLTDTRAAGAGPQPWLKAARLSVFEGDRSLRLRFGFGLEPDDDGSADSVGHRAATGLARQCLPELALIEGDRSAMSDLAEIAGEPLGAACPIAYWNRPQGGASFHHDAFAPVEPNGQRGVLFVQLAGATSWLALSTQQLVRRVIEFAELLADGEVPWVRDELAGSGALELIEAADGDVFALADEIALPGQGRLGALVNRGPEFTAYLADLGHAAVLRAGDAILLPNHGWRSTAMHSVMCASDGPNYALSLGLRPRGLVGAASRS